MPEPCYANSCYVSLDRSEFDMAWETGRKIYNHSRELGLNDSFCSRDGMLISQLGCVAEMAVAKAIGIEWMGWFDTFRKPDLDHNIEVRMLGKEHFRLKVRESDDDSRRVVGIVIAEGRYHEPYRIPGWVSARYAKKQRFVADPGGRGKPMYAVPQRNLVHLDVLKSIIDYEIQHQRRPCLLR